MFKLATATVLCSVGLSLCSDFAQAGGCCRRTSSCCCNPAPTCCAPAPSCAAPAPATTSPAPDAAPAPPPTPSAGTVYSDPSLAMTPNSNGSQTYRSFSYDAPSSPGTATYQPSHSRIRTYIPDTLKWRADRKMLGNY